MVLCGFTCRQTVPAGNQDPTPVVTSLDRGLALSEQGWATHSHLDLLVHCD